MSTTGLILIIPAMRGEKRWVRCDVLFGFSQVRFFLSEPEPVQRILTFCQLSMSQRVFEGFHSEISGLL